MTTIQNVLKVNKTAMLVHFAIVTLVLVGLWVSVTAVGEIRMFKSSTRSNLQNMKLDTRKVWTTSNMTTPLRCAEQCKYDNACVSFFYNKNTLSCQGHSMTLGITNGSTPVVGNKYYVDEDGEGYIGDVCTATSDCKVSDSECRNGACWCAAGYSFWPRSRSCEASCTSYGSDFTEVLDHYLHGNNEEDPLNTVRSYACRQRFTRASRLNTNRRSTTVFYRVSPSWTDQISGLSTQWSTLSTTTNETVYED